MTFLTFFKLFIKFLPEVVSLIKWIYQEGEDGVEDHVIKKRIASIHSAMTTPGRREAARGLSNVFRNRDN